jgi:hypothetical protein
MTDAINPPHYQDHPSGVECIQITEHMNFCLGNAIKYIWRKDIKHANPVFDLKKALWYIDREIERRSDHELEDISIRQQIRSKYRWSGQDDYENDQQKAINQSEKRISCDCIFCTGVQTHSEICSSDGDGNVRRPMPKRNGGFAQKRSTQRQQVGELGIREPQEQHGEASPASNGLFGSEKSSCKANARSGQTDSINAPYERNAAREDISCDSGHYWTDKAGRGLAIEDIAASFSSPISQIIKLIWRAGLKNNAIEDLRKARWYIDREIARIDHEQFSD